MALSNPQAILALATLLNEAVKAGANIADILDKAELSDEEWAKLENRAKQARENWHNAR